MLYWTLSLICILSSILLGTHATGCQSDAGDVPCNGRGTCLQNECVCVERANPEETISGEYCECDNFSCERSNGLICSGPNNGLCECGVCVCKEGWTGGACECSTSLKECKMNDDASICSGNGLCVCGACRCEITDFGSFKGKYCQHYPVSTRCEELKACVQCKMYKTGLSETQCLLHCHFEPIAAAQVEVNDESWDRFCTFRDDDDCQFTFKYSTIEVPLKVTATERRTCPASVQ